MDYLIVGLGFGDEGKGTITDYLARCHRTAMIIRYNGGPQAAHNVVTPDGRWHCFSQFGSATLLPEVATYLSRYTFIDPLALVNESQILASKGVEHALERLYIDAGCLVVTPYHQLHNRMQEIVRGANRHGSCGLGIGVAMRDSLQPRLPSIILADFADPKKLYRQLKLLWLIKIDLAQQYLAQDPQNANLHQQYRALQSDWPPEILQQYYCDFWDSGIHIVTNPLDLPPLPADSSIIYEGAQGVLLDMDHGFWPHVTPSHTTASNALAIHRQCWPQRPLKKIGILRAYATRHGVGPLVTEDSSLTGQLRDRHNPCNPWQGPLRSGWFDLLACRYAIAVTGGIDELALTNIDRLAGLTAVKVCHAYHLPDAKARELDNFCYQHTQEGVFLQTIYSCPSREQSESRTRSLNRCRPVYWDFPGWKQSKTSALVAHPNWLALAKFIQSPQGLGVPITIVSYGAQASAKVMWQP